MSFHSCYILSASPSVSNVLQNLQTLRIHCPLKASLTSGVLLYIYVVWRNLSSLETCRRSSLHLRKRAHRTPEQRQPTRSSGHETSVYDEHSGKQYKGYCYTRTELKVITVSLENSFFIIMTSQLWPPVSSCMRSTFV